MDKKHFARLFVLVAGLGAAVLTGTGARWPSDQSVQYVLGEAAGRVEEVNARWAAGEAAGAPDWTREVTFRYARGEAPPIVAHTPRLPDGDYTVQIEILAANERNTVTRHVRLSGGLTSIELARAVPR
jgi:hypothetical protein